MKSAAKIGKSRRDRDVLIMGDKAKQMLSAIAFFGVVLKKRLASVRDRLREG
jgi:hypothetical protein